MLEQALVALAAAGGAAVVQAAGTDAWGGLRRAFARWFGRGDAQREQAALDNLDSTASELETADEDARRDQAVMWRTRIADRLEDLSGDEQALAAAQLDALVNGRSSQGSATAGQDGLAVSGDFGGVHADRGSIAAVTIHGGAHIGPPPDPDPSQG
ncbi:hypothetical protein ACFWWA_20525 [Streptomyces goshikiensis]|uniref:hypothetical protein n=1 Tax=Streptomyces goshikiensis TaxID=1942 RepID=UPI00366826DC